jgi:hypothetical protein
MEKLPREQKLLGTAKKHHLYIIPPKGLPLILEEGIEKSNLIAS